MTSPYQVDETCLTIIEQAVASRSGIVEVDLDTREEKLAVAYDPQHISSPEIEQLTDDIAPRIKSRLADCTKRFQPTACDSCIMAKSRQTAHYTNGVLSITPGGAAVAPDIHRFVAPLGRTPTSEVPTQKADGWLTSDQLEAILVGLAFVAIITGLVSERLSVEPLITTLAFAIAYAAGGYFGLRTSWATLREFRIDVDLLMVLAAVGAWIVGSPFEGALLLFLFSLSNVLQNYALDRTKNAIRALMKLRPSEAMVRRGSRTVTLPVEQLILGDRVIVRPGERIPVDGVVVEGETSVDQAAITGESIPVQKEVGDDVLTGTINQSGGIEVRVTRLAKDSTIARIIKLVEDANSKKAHTERFLDKFEQYYALFVIVFTVAVILVPLYILGEPFDTAFYRGMTVMVAASPCALIISTPASILSGIGNGARRGLLFKGGVYLEQAANIKVIAFDKTGTLTRGKLSVTDIVPAGGVSDEELLRLAAAVEARSEHPLAQAVVAEATKRSITLPEAADFQSMTGKGVQAEVDSELIHIGNLRYFEALEGFDLSEVQPELTRLQDEGKTSVVVARGDVPQVVGVIALADILRDNVADIIQEIKALGVEKVVMLTGDNERVAKSIAKRAGLDAYYSELLPEDKVKIVEELKSEYGTIAMVGDGVNDAPALATANVGIAMGAAGTDVALETADIVLMSDDLNNIPYVVDLSRKTRQTLVINLGFAMLMIALMIGAIFLYNLPLPLAVVGHEGGTVLVSLHGLTLLAYKRRRKVS